MFPDGSSFLIKRGGVMKRFLPRLFLMLFAAAVFSTGVLAQQALTWQQVQERFATANPFLLAGQVGIEESRAQEITAYLRPNPILGLTADQLNPFPGGPSHSTFGDVLSVATVSYLHERRHKRELRLESAQDNTKITISGQADLQRNLLFTLRGAFVQILHEKAVFALAKENLSYYDHLLDVNRDRYKAGAIAQVDLDRLEIQRVQYESDLQTAEVNLRTAKIQLLQLLNDRAPVEQFDVTGPFDFNEQVQPLDEYRKIALDARADLRGAAEAVQKAKTDHSLASANGSTDPTLGTWYTHNSSNNNPFG